MSLPTRDKQQQHPLEPRTARWFSATNPQQSMACKVPSVHDRPAFYTKLLYVLIQVSPSFNGVTFLLNKLLGKSRRTWTVPIMGYRASISTRHSNQVSLFPLYHRWRLWLVMRREVLKHISLQRAASNHKCPAKTTKRAFGLFSG
jgi:hypothetical protein